MILENLEAHPNPFPGSRAVCDVRVCWISSFPSEVSSSFSILGYLPAVTLPKFKGVYRPTLCVTHTHNYTNFLPSFLPPTPLHLQ